MFVDESGRRHTGLRAAAWGTGSLVGGFGALVVLGLLSGVMGEPRGGWGLLPQSTPVTAPTPPLEPTEAALVPTPRPAAVRASVGVRLRDPAPAVATAGATGPAGGPARPGPTEADPTQTAPAAPVEVPPTAPGPTAPTGVRPADPDATTPTEIRPGDADPAAPGNPAEEAPPAAPSEPISSAPPPEWVAPDLDEVPR